MPLHRPGNVGGEADAVDVSICRACGGEERLDEAGLDIHDGEEDGELIEKKSDRDGDQRRWLKREVLSGQTGLRRLPSTRRRRLHTGACRRSCTRCTAR